MAIRQYDPTIGQHIRSVAGLFAPPSPTEQAAYATAKAKKEEAERRQEIYEMAKSAGADRGQLDRLGVAAGMFAPNQSYYSVDTDAATRRYGYDQSLAGAKYGADASAAASIQNNRLDNQRATVTNLYGPLSPGQVAPAVPDRFLEALGFSGGGIGERQGAAKPLSETEAKAQILRALSPQQQADTVLGAETPVQAKGPDGRATFMSPGQAVRTGAQPAADVTKIGEQAGKLRGEIAQLPSYKNYAQAAPIYRSMVDTAGTNSKASDLNLVYGLGKIMDPTSVVREGEMVLVQNTASLPDWVVGAANRLNGGAALQPETRAALLAEAHSRMRSYEDVLGADLDRYGGIADRAGVRRDDVLPPFERSNAYRGGGRQAAPTFPGAPAQAGQEPRPPAPPSPPTPPAIPADAVRVSTPEEAFALPPGTKFLTPDGRLKVRP